MLQVMKRSVLFPKIRAEVRHCLCLVCVHCLRDSDTAFALRVPLLSRLRHCLFLVCSAALRSSGAPATQRLSAGRCPHTGQDRRGATQPNPPPPHPSSTLRQGEVDQLTAFHLSMPFPCVSQCRSKPLNCLSDRRRRRRSGSTSSRRSTETMPV